MRKYFSTIWKTAFAGLTTALLLSAAPATAGRIDTGLEERMQTAGAEELLWVIIRPVGTVLGSQLKKQTAARHATRAGRHRMAVETLQAAAEAAQPAILDALTSAYFIDRTTDVQGFWIDNIITARMTPSAISELADRTDIDEILLMPPVSLIAPLAADALPGRPQAAPADALTIIEPGIKAIKADSMWALGYTGSGRLLGSLDTGVDGSHLLISPKWRGFNGYSVAESWFNPLEADTVPKFFSGNATSAVHGTQVMGIMVATFPTDFIPGFPGDTMGVCPDCHWMSAAAIDIPCPTAFTQTCGNLFEAMQWMADPDGDPVTEIDVPDAVANPWGALNTFGGCSDVFWNAIDNIEAAGAVMIFAAGNEGPGPATTRNPANRITTEINSFSVGMVDTRSDLINPPVDILSSRGPSDCDNATVKPEVVAPGVNIRSVFPPFGIDLPGQGTAYGTSFSTPHVTAGIALLREVNPNATVDEIKTAILESARDLGPTGPDNAYGHGLFDLMAAMRALPVNTEPSLYIKDDYYTRPAPGESADMVILLRSAGSIPATGISVNLISEDSRLTVLSGTASFPDVGGDFDTTGNFAQPFQFAVSADMISGERLPIRFEITADGGYSRTSKAAIQIGPSQTEKVFTHDAGKFSVSVAAQGMFGVQLDGFAPRPGGIGYFYSDDPRQSLFEGALLIGTDEDHISDNARDVSGVPDADFLLDVGGLLDIREPGNDHAEETRSGFTDAVAENPLGLFIEQRTWVDSDPARDDYLVIEYTMYNQSGATISGLRAGLFFDWDFPYSGDTVATKDGGGFNQTDGLGWMRHTDAPRLRGLAAINPMGTTSYRYYDNLTELFDLNVDGGFSDADKWRGLSGGFTQVVPPLAGDGSHMVSTGPFTLEADSTVTVAFVLVGGTSEAELVASVRQARTDYNAGVFSVSPGAMQFKAAAGGADPDPQDITLSNGTDEAVSFTVDAVPTWAMVIPGGGSVDPGSSMTLRMDASVGVLGVGSYNEDIVITSTDASSEQTEFRVSATLVVTDESVSGVPVDPNPFYPADGTVSLNFDLPTMAGVRAVIYDMVGEEVVTLPNDGKNFSAGSNSITWDGKSKGGEVVAEGIYLCHIMATSGGKYETVLKIALKK